LTRKQAIFAVLIAIAFGVLFAVLSPTVVQWIFTTYGRANLTTPVTDPEIAQANRYVNAYNPYSIAGSGLLGLIVGAGFARLLAKIAERQVSRWENMDTGDKVNLFLGIFVGLLVSMPFLILLNSLPGVNIPLAVIGLTIGLSAISVYALGSMGDVLPWSKAKGPAKRRGIKILDTNVLIDGRIYDVARTGFVEGQIYVPGFVLEELQHIADSHDGLRRQRGRRGLDVLRHMQADFPVEVRIHDKLAPDIGDEVDSRLVRLARAMGADIVTNDFNLNRVAAVQQVKVLNLNDLTLSLRPNVLPSESLNLTIVREGNQAGQGVGYLEDGTMVVVENGKAHLGETLDVTVTQVIQTERGKMIFAELGEESEEEFDPRARRKARTSRSY
jgi:uncharacterized protein YacL